MRGRTLYFVFILIAYTIGIWTFSLVPKILMTTGLTGLGMMLIFSGIVGAMIVFEAGEISRRGYRVHEFMTKVGRMPTVSIVMLVFLFIMTGIIGHYTGIALEKIFGISIPGIGIITVLLALGLLLLAKSKSLDLIVIFSILLIILTVFAAFFLGSKAEEFVTKESSYQFISTTLDKLHSFQTNIPVTIVVETFLVTLLIFGLGVGFYYVIGSSLAAINVDMKRILLVVILLQIVLSMLSALIITYSIGISHQAYWTAFESGKAMEAMDVYNKYFRPLWREYTSPEDIDVKPLIETVFGIPEILAKLKVKGWYSFTIALMLSIFFAGFTTILVLLESGAQLAMDVFQTTRKNSLIMISLISSILAGLSYLGPLRATLLATIVLMVPLYALVELFPIARVAEEKRIWVLVLSAILVIVWIPMVFMGIQSGKDVQILGIIVGLMLLVPLAFNRMFAKTTR
ncbi:sodium-dependent transporter [Pyrococcus sp. ST04]|uniref:sodium-dependent transporter n=1 Tax=Pyrococcus sp. ST04 TaxID=1183377 RepID=UPI0002606029|nr:sodium-dependent transporter [Pyrococcus sp. ST04]AFK22781.1 hypothetical protein Py04_1207 [Pyrococcus sp. ST04]